MIQGHNRGNLSQGESVIELMNALKIDSMVAGNHEFDFGQEVLKKKISESRFPILGANVGGLDGLKPYLIQEFKGIKIAVIGIVTEETPVSTHPRNVSGLRFSQPAEARKKFLPELRRQASFIIVFSHLGHACDRSLAESVKGIDVIGGGHSHAKVLKRARIGNTWIVQAWEHGNALGVLDLTLKDGKVVTGDGRLEEIKPISGRWEFFGLLRIQFYSFEAAFR